jgi:tetratricopeptide (TPR) repeat protein
VTSRIRLSFGALAALAAITVVTAEAGAQAATRPVLNTGELDPPQVKPEAESTQGRMAGNYLAARHATAERDSAAAANFYKSVLRDDPGNGDLLERAFISLLIEGKIDDSAPLADKVLQADKNNRVARLVLGVRALKQKKYAIAQQNINQSVRGPITDLVAALLSGWARYGAGDAKAAVASIDKLQGPEWYPLFKDLHAGLILDQAGSEKEAGARFERAYNLDNSALRVVQAYADWLSRNNGRDKAATVFADFDKKLPRHPLIVDGMRDINAGKAIPPLVTTPQAGAAEALYGVGASLSHRGGEDLALVYLQLALYLEPTHPLALLSLGDLYEMLKKPELAIDAYQRVPASSPLKRNAQIQMATDLDTLDRSDEAIGILKNLTTEQPKDIEALLALGNIERGRKKFDDCGGTYTRAIDALPAPPDNNNWVVYYFRGICFERSKQWPKAEADLRKALEMQPEQANVLNYLGYSWIDQGINLDEGMSMIKRAVDQRPDDGYIVDSLGWAYFKIGNYDEAAKTLERAIDLKPEDPTINDHLGDAYWRIGRKLEAQFQWAHARDLNPDPEDLPKIEAKLKDGLPDDKQKPSSASVDKDKKDGNGG